MQKHIYTEVFRTSRLDRQVRLDLGGVMLMVGSKQHSKAWGCEENTSSKFFRAVCMKQSTWVFMKNRAPNYLLGRWLVRVWRV